MNKKILFSDNSLRGLVNFRGNIIRHYAESGFEVVLVAPADSLSEQPAFPQGVRYIAVEMERTGTDPRADIRYYKALKAIYKAERPEYIFHYTIKPNIYGTLAAHALKIRSTAVVAGLGHVYTAGGVGNRLARIMYKYALRFAEKIMVLNRSNAETLLARKVVPAGKLLWLEGGEGIDLAKYQRMAMPGHEKTVFLMIGRVLYEKGYREFAETAAALKDVAEFRLLGPLDSHPSAVAEETVAADVKAGNIRYFGFSPDVVSYMADADCILLPSYHEGLSRVLMEAVALGRPVICSDIPGCRETVDDGINGFLCEPRNTGSLTAACRRFITLLPEQRMDMSLASRTKAERTFDVESVIRTYRTII